MAAAPADGPAADPGGDEQGSRGGVPAGSVRAAVWSVLALLAAVAVIGARGHGRSLVVLGLAIAVVLALLLRRRVQAWYRRPWDDGRMIR